MPLTKIEPLVKSETQDYSKEEITNIWLLNTKETTPNNNQEQNLNTLLDFLQKTQKDSVLCIYSKAFEGLDPKLREALFECAKDRRVYLLSNAYTKVLEELGKNALVRVGLDLEGSFILLKNGNSIEGLFLPHSLANLNHFPCLRLESKEQKKEFFAFFCYLFWKEATLEYLNGEKIDITQNNQEDFLRPYKNPLDSEYLLTTLQEANQEIKKGASSINDNSPIISGNEKESSLYIMDYKNTDKNLLLKLSNKNAIYYIKNLNFDFCITQTESFIIPRNLDTKNLYALKLTQKQAKIFRDFLDNLPIDAKFIKSITKQELQNKQFISLNSLDTPITIEKSITHEDIIQATSLLPLEELEKQTLDYQAIKKEKGEHCCKIVFKTTILPYFTPKEFKLSNLYQQWEKSHNNLQEEIKNLIGKITKNNDLNTKWEEKFQEMKRFFLGMGQNFKEIQKSLEAISQKAQEKFDSHTLNRENFREYTKELQKIRDKITENETTINKKQEEIKQHKQWEQDKTALQKTIQNLEKNLQQEKKILEELQSKNSKTKEEAKDTKVISGRIKEQEKKIQKLEKDLKMHKEQLEKEYKDFTPKLSNQTSTLEPFKTNSTIHKNSTLEPPSEDLPTIGTLLEHKENRLLEIEFYEDLQKAKEEARRLRAKLSAKVIETREE